MQQMGLDRGFADMQIVRHLFIAGPASDERQDLQFALTEERAGRLLLSVADGIMFFSSSNCPTFAPNFPALPLPSSEYGKYLRLYRPRIIGISVLFCQASPDGTALQPKD